MSARPIRSALPRIWSRWLSTAVMAFGAPLRFPSAVVGRVCWVRGRWSESWWPGASVPRVRPEGLDARDHEGADEVAGIVGVGEVASRRGGGEIGDHDAHRPLGGPEGLVRVEPAAEERGGKGARRQEGPVHLGKGQLRED